MEGQVCLCDCRQCDQIRRFRRLCSWDLSCWPSTGPFQKSTRNSTSSKVRYAPRGRKIYHFGLFTRSDDYKWIYTENYLQNCLSKLKLNLKLADVSSQISRGPMLVLFKQIIHSAELKNTLENSWIILKDNVVKQKVHDHFPTTAYIGLYCLV